MAGNSFLLEVKPRIPDQLSQLPRLANDLLYSWRSEILNLFMLLDESLWRDCSHNPKLLLRYIDQSRLQWAAQDADYLQRYQAVVQRYEAYHKSTVNPKIKQLLDPDQDLIAYFCTEFGFHESLRIYSGGLGILAGDHCKAASDLNIPFVGVGLLYHQGYFRQTIDPDGNQVSHHPNQHFGHLPLRLYLDNNNHEVHTQVSIQGRNVTLRIWMVQVGRVSIYLLDSDVESNSTQDREITAQLYGGDQDTRIKQEIVLGIGGVKALRKLGLNPNVWHINEGHAAFQILERSREMVETGHDFNNALERVSCNTVFTTHTPVAAGHDNFSHERMREYFSDYTQSMAIDFDKLISLGASPIDDQRFNMTALALRGSRFHNGVSKTHGAVASTMESYIWPEIPADDNPITSITNGVHVQSILNKHWATLYDDILPHWQENLVNTNFWLGIDSIPNEDYWHTHQAIKREMLRYICQKITLQHQRNTSSRSLTRASIRYIDENADDILVLGFARRFATYKRSTLLFSDPQRLAKIVNNSQRPVVILFAGKAHPHDEPGKQMLREIHHYAAAPEFIGKIILLEGYDLALARHLFAGTDVWLNTPIYPLEACGTSGIKASMNGVVNLSVLDGWWAEGYNGDNGWAIDPHSEKYGQDYQNRQEANDLYELLENEVVPAYFNRQHSAYPPEWLRLSKNAMKSVTPQFSSHRMLLDYINQLYLPAKQQAARLCNGKDKDIEELIKWKNKVISCWSGLSISSFDKKVPAIDHGTPWTASIAVNLNGLAIDDVTVECLFGTINNHEGFSSNEIHTMTADNNLKPGDNTVVFSLELDNIKCGLHHYKIRIYPHHTLLSNRFEMGFMRWL